MRTKLTRLDKKIFEDMERFNKEERQILLKHLKDLMIQLKEGDITMDDSMEILKGLLISINTLKKLRN